MVKASSSKILVAFLFNDFLMFARPNKKIGKLSNKGNFFHNKKALEIGYSIHRKPLFLNEFSLVEISAFETSNDPAMFRLQVKSNRRLITLRTNSQQECVMWMSLINSTQANYLNIYDRRKEESHRMMMPNKPSAVLYLTVIEAVQLYTRNCKFLKKKSLNSNLCFFQIH